MIIVRIVQFVKIVQLVQLNYYGYIKFFGGFVGTWVGAFTYNQAENACFIHPQMLQYIYDYVIHSLPDCEVIFTIRRIIL